MKKKKKKKKKATRCGTHRIIHRAKWFKDARARVRSVMKSLRDLQILWLVFLFHPLFF